jgi:hypothetical protein
VLVRPLPLGPASTTSPPLCAGCWPWPWPYECACECAVVAASAARSFSAAALRPRNGQKEREPGATPPTPRRAAPPHWPDQPTEPGP